MSKSRRQDKRALEVTKTVAADLEVVRTEERLGGVIAQKENEDLFYIDTAGKNSVSSSAKPVKKSLKIDQILKPESSYTINRTYQIKGSKAEETLVAKKIKALSEGKTVTVAPKRNSGKSTTLYDAWGDDDFNAVFKSSKKSKFVPVMPAVPVPDAFISYNPSREDHLAQLESLESQELTRLECIEVFKKSLPKNEVSNEFSEDLVVVANRKLATGEVSDDEDISNYEGGETFLGGSTQVNRKKTLQQRKRQLRHKELMAECRSKRQDKTVASSIDRVPELLAQIQTVQQTRQEAEQILAPIEKEIRKERQLKKIKQRLVMEPLNIKLPEELPASMRQLAPEGNLVTDRFRSLIERGVVEATTHKILSADTKAMNRSKGKSVKPRIKMVEKFSYKDFK